MRATHFRASLSLVAATLTLLLHSQQVTSHQRGFVHARGAQLEDGAGKPLMLRGINLGNWFEPEGYMFHFEGGPQSPREIEDLTKELIGPEKSAAFWRQWRETYITESRHRSDQGDGLQLGARAHSLEVL